VNNKQIVRHVNAFAEARQGWIDILLRDPDSITAVQHILSINSKIELLKTLWNWSEDDVVHPDMRC